MKMLKCRYTVMLLCIFLFIAVVISGGCGGGGGGSSSGGGDGGGIPSVVGKLEPVGKFQFKDNEIADILEMEYKDNVYQIDGIYLYLLDTGTIELDRKATAKNLLTNEVISLDKLQKDDVVIITPQRVEDICYSLMLKLTDIIDTDDLYRMSVTPVNIESIFEKFRVNLKLDIDTRFNDNIIVVTEDGSYTAAPKNLYQGARFGTFDNLPKIVQNDNGGMDVKFTYSEGGQALTTILTNVSFECVFDLEESFARVSADSIKLDYNALNADWSKVYYLLEHTFWAGPIPIVFSIELNPYMGLSMSIACEFEKPFAQAKAWIFEAPSNGSRLVVEGSCGNPNLQKPTIEPTADGKCGVKLDAKLYAGVPERLACDAENVLEKLFPNVWFKMIVNTLVDMLKDVNAGLYATVANVVVSGRVDNSLNITPAPFLADIALKHQAGFFVGGFSMDSEEYVSLQYPLLFVIQPSTVTLKEGETSNLSVYPDLKGPNLAMYNWSSDNSLIASIESTESQLSSLTVKAQKEGETNVRCWGPVHMSLCSVKVLPGDGGVTSGDVVVSDDVDDIKETYRIYDADDLITFMGRVNSGESELDAVLMNDIYMYKDLPSTIGNIREKAYSGTFNGQGYTITNCRIRISLEFGTIPNEDFYLPLNTVDKGLFGYVNNARIKNLNVVGDIYCKGFEFHIGGIVGESLNSTISNCSFEGIVECDARVGYASGICAIAKNSIIEQCVNRARVLGARGVSSGIVAETINCSVEYCVNDGAIGYTTDKNAFGGVMGGIVGSAKNSKIYDAVNNGIINSTQANAVGGIVGKIGEYSKYGDTNSIVTRSSNYANVTGYNKVGGIVGEIQKLTQVSSCFNYGDVEAIWTVPDDPSYTVTPEDRVFCGDIYGYCEEEDPYAGL